MKLDASKIGRNIKIQRIQADLTQEELAEILDVSAQQISNWESGKNLISLTRLVEISLHFQIDINILLGAEYSSIPEKSLSGELAILADEMSAEDLSLCVSICRTIMDQRKEKSIEKQADGQRNA